MAAWLCREVGPHGNVTATDIDVRFLNEIDKPNITVRQHDIVKEDLPRERFDVVHARWLLHHLPDPEAAISQLVGALRPGGWILLEELDCFPFHTSTYPVYVRFMEALTGTVVAATGRKNYWARALPSLLTQSSLEDVGAEGDVAILRGGSPLAEFLLLTSEQMKDRVLASGEITIDDWKAAMVLLGDSSFWGFAWAGIAASGRRPKP
jgi:SAM-dependent methyltransferase